MKAGLRAALQLLHGAREKGINRLYVKNGGYSRATKDFYSVNPKYVESSVTEQGQVRIELSTEPGHSIYVITKTHLFKYMENFTSKKLKFFR